MLKIEKLNKFFGDNHVLHSVNLEIKKGEIPVIIGPSGSGKSTLLRSINMLEVPTNGKIFLDNQEITNDKMPLNILRQRIGMVFQHFNLFENMSVLENIILSPNKVSKINKEECIEKALKLLNHVGLKNKADSMPHELSGGQKQRVAIVRSLATDPNYILFDEPTSALDPEMVNEVLNVIKDVSKKITSIIVSHEMSFVEDIATRIIFMQSGKIVEDCKADEISLLDDNSKIKKFLKKIQH